MENDFCIGCEGYPSCAIFGIANGVLLSDIINECLLKKIQYPVCHKNAQKIESGKMVTGPGCDGCTLCRIACSKSESVAIDFRAVEKSVLSDLGRLNIFASSLNKNAVAATEVKTYGNFRQKRVDLVIKHGNSIFLIKVLQNLDKYNFYYRSYDEIIRDCQNRYPEFRFFHKTLIPAGKREQAEKLGLEFILIDELNILEGK